MADFRIKRQTKRDHIVEDAREMIAVARELLDAHMKTNSKAQLIAACLCVNHLKDWLWADSQKTPEGAQRFERLLAALAKKELEWEAFHDIANGLKHPLRSKVPEFFTDLAEWEDDDWWNTAAGDDPIWFVMIGDNRRALSGLCTGFIYDFERCLSPAQTDS